MSQKPIDYLSVPSLPLSTNMRSAPERKSVIIKVIICPFKAKFTFLLKHNHVITF